jgi:acyl-CoA synthetase (AMP-forming)/AMP-acid ligase II
MQQPSIQVVADDRPQQVLAALDGTGPIAVVDHRNPVAAAALAALPPSSVPGGTWLVAHTSGSTSAPRAVCRSRESWEASAQPFAAATGTSAATRVLVPGPLSSTLFLHAAWHARHVGATPLLLAAGTALDWRVAPTLDWDVVHLVPHQLGLLLDAAGGGPGALSGRTAVVAGAALPEHLRARAQRHGLRVVAYYGASELSFVAIGETGGLRAMPGVEIAVRHGEIWVRSPYVALGYAGVSDVEGPWRQDAAGWATVGDRGEVHRDGTVVVRGRGAAAVQTGGATVHVADVEAALRGHEHVSDVAVVALPHDRLGHVVGAVVESSVATPRALRAWARTHLPIASRPRVWRVVPSLGRTTSGKPDRAAAERLLRETHADQTVPTSRSRA